MKYLEQTDIITYDNGKEYIVIDSIILDDNNFVYLVQKDDLSNHMFCLVTKENGRIRVDEIDSSSKNNREIIGRLLEEMTVDLYKNVGDGGLINNEDRV